MADLVSDDQAVEVLAKRKRESTALRPGYSDAEIRLMAERDVEALASAGFQITNLTPEEAKALLRSMSDNGGRGILGLPVESKAELSAKLRVLASSPSGEETRET